MTSPPRLVKYSEAADGVAEDSRLYKQDLLIKTAEERGWIGERFDYFIKNNTAGSAVLDTPDSFSFIAQTPKNDGFPFFAISLTQRFTEAHHHDDDWESLVFVRPASLWDDVVEPMLGRDIFPQDNPYPLKPDFMVLPVVLLRCQVEQITNELNEMKSELETRDPDFTAKRVDDLKVIKHDLFILQKKNFYLHRRRAFASELAENLMEAFGFIARRYLQNDETPEYSPALRARVAIQQANLKNVKDDLVTTASRIESQQKFVSSRNIACSFSGLYFTVSH